jgi:EAL domain-containing protein (putative c-di-GMP-specific phosphodiesterase class I)
MGPQAIQFEITESALTDDQEVALETIAQLNDIGVELYIDDFGIGYSSLSYLQKLPVDSIKIDQSFVKSMLGSKDSETIVRSTIDLGHNLKRSVVAEGVESQALWECLLELGCDAAQGYFISEPMPAEQFGDWQRHSSWTDSEGLR